MDKQCLLKIAVEIICEHNPNNVKEICYKYLKDPEIDNEIKTRLNEIISEIDDCRNPKV